MCAVCRGVGLFARDCRRDRIDPAAGDGEQGYPNKFGVGVIGTAGALGILIPPSIVMVIYAVSTNSSIGRLFIAGSFPASW